MQNVGGNLEDEIPASRVTAQDDVLSVDTLRNEMRNGSIGLAKLRGEWRIRRESYSAGTLDETAECKRELTVFECNDSHATCIRFEIFLNLKKKI